MNLYAITFKYASAQALAVLPENEAFDPVVTYYVFASSYLMSLCFLEEKFMRHVDDKLKVVSWKEVDIEEGLMFPRV